MLSLSNFISHNRKLAGNSAITAAIKVSKGGGGSELSNIYKPTKDLYLVNLSYIRERFCDAQDKPTKICKFLRNMLERCNCPFNNLFTDSNIQIDFKS